MSRNKKTAAALLIITVLMIVIPVIALKGAAFGGSDDAGSVMAKEIAGTYEPWFTPVLETVIGGEVPGELESLLFCIQTGIGVGVIAFCMGRMVERKKWTDERDGRAAVMNKEPTDDRCRDHNFSHTG